MTRVGYTNALAAELTRDALLRNWKIAEGYGCFDAEGLSEIRQGKSPTIQRAVTTTRFQHFSFLACQHLPRGVDHIVPRAAVPLLGGVGVGWVACCRLISAFQVFSVSAFSPLGSRQVQKAEELHRAGLLRKEGLANVRASGYQ